MTRSAQGEAEVSCEYEFNRVHSVVCDWVFGALSSACKGSSGFSLACQVSSA
jgi:hypothetical protein